MHDERLKGTVKICYRSKTGFAGNEGEVDTLPPKNCISEHAVTRERECTFDLSSTPQIPLYLTAGCITMAAIREE
jgi:hypothetical protein